MCCLVPRCFSEPEDFFLLFGLSISRVGFTISLGLSLQLLQMGAFPVFVVDGQPSPLKSQARAARFFRGSGMDLAALPSTEAESSGAATPVKGRNAAFTRCVEECVVSSRISVLLYSFAHSTIQFTCGCGTSGSFNCSTTVAS